MLSQTAKGGPMGTFLHKEVRVASWADHVLMYCTYRRICVFSLDMHVHEARVLCDSYVCAPLRNCVYNSSSA
jgi:hypothetical protein